GARCFTSAVVSPGCWPTIFVVAFLRIPGPCSRGLPSVPTKSSGVWLIPHTLPYRLRAVRNSWTTSGARLGESSSAQHSSSTVIDGWPHRPDARCATALAMTMLIDVSSNGSALNPSTLKNSQLESSRIVVGRSNKLAYTPFSPVHERSLIEASFASSIVRSIRSSSRQLASSSLRSLNVGVGFENRALHRL